MNEVIKKRLCILVMAGLIGSSYAVARGHAASTGSAVTFQRIATFPVYRNLPLGQDEENETIAEIVAVSADANMLIYTDSEQERVGFVNIRDAENPKPAGFVQLSGEPTSVAVSGRHVLIVVNTSADYVNTSGELVVVRVSDRGDPVIDRSFSLGGQPDSIAVSPNGRYAVIAIENERDEKACPDGSGGLIDSAYGNEASCEAAGAELGGLPQFPGGFLEMVDLRGAPVQWRLEHITIDGIADLAPDDPEPEFVSINRKGKAIVTLQENNHILVLDTKKRRI